MMPGSEIDDGANYVCDYDNQKFDLQRNCQIQLAEDEVALYGPHKRAPKGLRKLDLLGKGGCAIVWLCQDSNGQKFAVK